MAGGKGVVANKKALREEIEGVSKRGNILFGAVGLGGV